VALKALTDGHYNDPTGEHKTTQKTYAKQSVINEHKHEQQKHTHKNRPKNRHPEKKHKKNKITKKKQHPPLLGLWERGALMLGV